jgi:hypothetical protein
VGGVPEITGAAFWVAAVTVIEKAANDADKVPSLTVITMLDVVPWLALVGVPDSRPVDVLNEAHEGLFAIEKDRVCPSGSEEVGVNEYAWPATILVAGVPAMTGARLADAATEIEKAGRAALSEPSETVMTMPLKVRTSVAAGVPDSLPVAVLNEAQLGRFVIENVSELPSGSLAKGVKLYGEVACTEVAGVPEMVGARFPAGGLVGGGRLETMVT